MIRWLPYTFVRTTIFLCAGILAGIFCPEFLSLQLVIEVAALTVLAYLLSYVISRRLQLPVNHGYIALPIVFLIGYAHAISFNESKDSDHLFSKDSIAYYRITVDSYAEEKENSWKMTGRISAVYSGKWETSKANVLLYFRKKHFQTPFTYGDVLLIRGEPGEVPAPGNPNEFDYKKFLSFKNVFHQHFPSAKDVQLIGQDGLNPFKYYALRTRLWANQVLHEYIDGERERAVSSALILGVTDGLDHELLGAYSATGAMHVLAVSGLHISIIYIIILFVMKPLTKTVRGKAFVIAFSLFFLWGYAFVTGLSPSVLRAVMMFSFFAVAKIAARNTNVYNTLAASAFCLLIFDPYLIMSVGFQLSYLAVLGILYIHPLLQRLWEPESWLANEIWKVSSVSIAAQISTLPLSLYYFHQFPNYFLLSNLLVIPLSFVVLILGLAILAAGFVPVLASVIGIGLHYTIWLLNFSVIAVEWLPFSVIANISISAVQCWLMAAVIVSILLVLQKKGYVWFRVSAVFVMCFAMADWLAIFSGGQYDSLTVYKVSGKSAVDFISDGKAFFVGDLSEVDARRTQFHVSPHRLANMAQPTDQLLAGQVVQGGRFILWNKLKILYLNERVCCHPVKESVDIIIIAKDALPFADLAGLAPTTTVIFDGSNSLNYLKEILKTESKAKLHSVIHSGSLTIRINNGT